MRRYTPAQIAKLNSAYRAEKDVVRAMKVPGLTVKRLRTMSRAAATPGGGIMSAGSLRGWFVERGYATYEPAPHYRYTLTEQGREVVRLARELGY